MKTKMNDRELDHEPEQRVPPAVGPGPDADRPGRAPAAQEQRDGQGADREHADVLGQVEQRELQRRVLGVVPADQLALALGQVERQPVGLAHHGDHVDDERRQQQDGEPRRPVQGRAEPVELGAARLRLHDRGGGQRPGVQEDRDERQPHRDLVADHLGRRAQRAEQRVGRVRRPPGQHDPVHAHRAHGQDQQHRYRQVSQLQRGALAEDRDDRPERDDREADEHRDGRQGRGDDEQQLVHAARDDVLFERQLDAVHQRLEQAELAGPVGAGPLLHAPDDAPLGPDREQRAQHQEQEDGQDLDDDEPPGVLAEAGQGRDVCPTGRRPGPSFRAPQRH